MPQQTDLSDLGATRIDLSDLGATRATISKGKKEGPIPTKNWADFLAEYGGMIGGTAGGVAGMFTGPGAVPMAAAGGVIGKATGKAIQARFGEQPVSGVSEVPEKLTLKPSGGVALELGVEGLTQGLYEALGRTVAAGVRATIPLAKAGVKRLIGKAGAIFPPVTKTIGGEAMPLSGSALATPGGFLQTIEGYLVDSWIGGKLKAARTVQQSVSRSILAKLSEASIPITQKFGAAAEALSSNWARAKQATRLAAEPIYDRVRATPVPEATSVAKEFLADTELAPILGPRARRVLTTLAEGADASDLKTVLGISDDVWKTMKPETLDKFKAALAASGVDEMEKAATFGMAKLAGTEIMDAAQRVAKTHPNDARLLRDAAAKLNEIAKAALGPEEREAIAQADLLWRRSYIMGELSDTFAKMERVQAPQDAPRILTRNFVQAVNRLAHKPVSRAGGRIVERPSKLDILFDSPGDREALVDLAQFLQKESVRNAAGLTNELAHIGLVLSGVSLATGAAAGSLTAAIAGHPEKSLEGATSGAALGLGTLYVLSGLLAKPGGVVALRGYFRAPSSAAAALLVRFATEMEGEAQALPTTRELHPTAPKVGGSPQESQLTSDVRSGRSTMTDVMLAAKFGEIPASAPRRIDRSLRRPPPPPPH